MRFFKLFLSAMLTASPLAASVLDITPHVGVSTVNMAGLNKSDAGTWGWEDGGFDTDVNSALVAGLDLTTKRLTSLDWLDLGLRGEWLQTNMSETYSPPSLDDQHFTDQGYLTSLLLGAKALAPVGSGRLSVGLGAWIGWGHAAVAQRVQVDPSPDALPLQDGVFTTNLLQIELESQVRLHLFGGLSLDVQGGWRWADAPSLQNSGGTALYDGIKRWEYGENHAINVDFSGATAQGGLSYSF